MQKTHNRRRSTRPEFSQLEAFLTVVEAGSFAAAARLLGISQPAVSQTIARLEELYGGDLFERRRGTPVALTPIGRAILPKARLLLFTVDQQIRHAIATAQSMTGSLKIGFQTGLGCGPLVAALGEFVGAHKDVQLQLIEAPPSQLYHQLNDRIIDIIFTGLLPELAGGINEQEQLWKEPLLVALAETHPLTSKTSLNWVDLSSLPIVLRSPHGDLSAYRAVIARAGEHHIQCNLHDVSRGALLDMVKLGFGATILFASAVIPRDGVTFRPIAEENAYSWVEAVWPKDDRNPLRHRFLACVRKHAALIDVPSSTRPSAIPN